MVDSLLSDKKGRTLASRNGARLTRTVLMGSVVVAFALYWLADSYQVDLDMMLGYLQTSVVFVVFFAVTGALAGALLWLIRYLRRR